MQFFRLGAAGTSDFLISSFLPSPESASMLNKPHLYMQHGFDRAGRRALTNAAPETHFALEAIGKLCVDWNATSAYA
jgi:hypothetical protein